MDGEWLAELQSATLLDLGKVSVARACAAHPRALAQVPRQVARAAERRATPWLPQALALALSLPPSGKGK